MPTPPLTDDQLREAIETVERHQGHVTKAGVELGLSRTTLQGRLHTAEVRKVRPGFKATGFCRNLRTVSNPLHPQRIEFEIDNGVVLIASDCHYWPNYISTAHKAFVKWCRKFKPVAVVLNGDVLDAGSISRHPPINWSRIPDLSDEIKNVDQRLDEIRKAAKNAKLIWTLGNHDARYEQRLATVAPEYADLRGMSLKDHFPHWHPAYSCWINDDLVIKHRFKNGIHAPWNSTIYAGRSMVLGHLHSQKIYPFSDYNGTRWGVDAGCMADPYGPQFLYAEDNPVNWRSGFAMLTIRDGKLQNAPELIRVMEEGRVDFRGEVIEIS